MRRTYNFTVQISFEVEGEAPPDGAIRNLVDSALTALESPLNEYEGEPLDKLSKPSWIVN